MKVDLRCFAKLADLDTCGFNAGTPYQLDDGQTVDHLLDRAAIRREEVKVAFVNGRKVDFNTVLSEGDRVGLAPAVGGM